MMISSPGWHNSGPAKAGAWIVGRIKLAAAPNGKAMTDTGKYVVVSRKVGNEWKAAADIFNSDLAASGG